MRIHLILFIVIANFSTFISIITPKAFSFQSRDDGLYLFDSIRIGAGFDSQTGEFKKNCIVKISSPVVFEFKDKSTFEIIQIDKLSKLIEALELPGPALIQNPPPSLYREKTNFFNSIAFNRFNHFILAKTKITLMEKNIGDSNLKEKYIGYLKENGIDQFAERCGNSYLSGYSMGIEYFFLFEIRSKTELENDQDTAIFKSLNKMPLKQAKFFETLEYFSKLNIKNVYAFKQGDILTLKSPKKSEIIDVSKQIKFKPTNKKPKPHSFTFAPYEPLTKQQNLHPNQAPLETIRDYYAQNLETLLDLDYIDTNMKEFKHISFQAKIPEWKNQANDNLSYLSRLFSLCSNPREQCTEPERKYLLNPISRNLVVKQFDESFYKNHSCTTTIYKIGRSERCGIASYKQKQMPYCGVAEYNKATNKLCPGSIPPLGPKILKKTKFSFKPMGEKQRNQLNLECKTKFGSDWIYSDINPVSHGPLQSTLKVEGQDAYYTCIRLAKIVSCRHPSHGVKAYKKCQHPNHGVEQFRECRLPEFGIDYTLPSPCSDK